MSKEQEKKQDCCPELESECACANLRKAARAITQLYDETFRPIGYRSTQINILAAAAHLGPIPLTRLAEETVTDRTTLTRNLSLLEKKGFICNGCGEDRREHLVSITDKGRAVLKKAEPLWRKLQLKMTQEIGEERLKRLFCDLAKVIEAAKRV